MTENETPGPFASSPCMAHELDPAFARAADPQQAADVARWRRARRAQLRAARDALAVRARQEAGQAIARHLRALLDARHDGARGCVLSAYWPIKGEPDLRGLMADLHAAGVTVALPVVETRAAPLVFRRWTPATRMQRGDWNIPVPPPEAAALRPDIVLAPCLGWTREGFRLGYGGGYFDRTLAALDPRPVTIGIGFAAARLDTIYPQPHDIPLCAVVTEDGPRTPA